MSNYSFSKRYLEIIDYANKEIKKNRKIDDIFLHDLKLQLYDLFNGYKFEAKEKTKKGISNAFHFGKLEGGTEGGLELLRASTLFIDKIFFQDIIYRSLLTYFQYDEDVRKKYIILGDETKEKLRESIMMYIEGLYSIKSFIENDFIQIIPHPTMLLNEVDVTTANELTSKYFDLFPMINASIKEVDRLLNYIVISSVKMSSIPYSNWEEGIDYMDFKLRLLGFFKSEINRETNILKNGGKTKEFYKEYDKFDSQFDETYKISLIPEVLKQFDYVEEYVKRKVDTNFNDLIELRKEYEGFRQDFCSLIGQIELKPLEKYEIEEIVNSIADEIKKELEIAKKSITIRGKLTKIRRLSSKIYTYASLDPIGTFLSLPDLPDELIEIKKKINSSNTQPNQVLMLLKRLEEEHQRYKNKYIKPIDSNPIRYI